MSWLSSLFGGKKSSDSSTSSGDIIDQYSYKPQYTAQTEKGLYDLFSKTNGSQGVNAIPYDIGLPTTGLYDALTRGIKEQYLGTPGGPEGGRIADTRAYYNNMGIPEYAANQERLGNQDLNNSLLDTAAEINNNQKDRLLNVLGLGANVGSNLYSQNLGQQRYNAGLAQQGAQFDAGLNQAINSANQSSLASLLAGAGAIGTSMFTGNPTSALSFSGQSNPNAPVAVSQNGTSGFGIPSLLGSAGSSNQPKSSKLIY